MGERPTNGGFDPGSGGSGSGGNSGYTQTVSISNKLFHISESDHFNLIVAPSFEISFRDTGHFVDINPIYGSSRNGIYAEGAIYDVNEQIKIPIRVGARFPLNLVYPYIVVDYSSELYSEIYNLDDFNINYIVNSNITGFSLSIDNGKIVPYEKDGVSAIVYINDDTSYITLEYEVNGYSFREISSYSVDDILNAFNISSNHFGYFLIDEYNAQLRGESDPPSDTRSCGAFLLEFDNMTFDCMIETFGTELSVNASYDSNVIYVNISEIDKIRNYIIANGLTDKFVRVRIGKQRYSIFYYIDLYFFYKSNTRINNIGSRYTLRIGNKIDDLVVRFSDDSGNKEFIDVDDDTDDVTPSLVPSSANLFVKEVLISDAPNAPSFDESYNGNNYFELFDLDIVDISESITVPTPIGTVYRVGTDYVVYLSNNSGYRVSYSTDGFDWFDVGVVDRFQFTTTDDIDSVWIRYTHPDDTSITSEALLFVTERRDVTVEFLATDERRASIREVTFDTYKKNDSFFLIWSDIDVPDDVVGLRIYIYGDRVEQLKKAVSFNGLSFIDFENEFYFRGENREIFLDKIYSMSLKIYSDGPFDGYVRSIYLGWLKE